jgi:hypothetical protein
MSHASAPWLWARSTIRGHWRATIFLAVFAGLASGAVLTGVEVARRTSSAYERYLGYAHIAAVSFAACPVGVTQDSLAGGFDVCFSEENSREVSGIVSRLPGVAGVGRVALSPVGVADPSLPSGWQGTLALSTIEAGLEYSFARPIVVDGRLPTTDAADEVAVNEELLRSASLRLGDTMTLGTISAADLSQQEQANFVPNGARSSPRIVGVVRLPDDLQPGQSTRGIDRLTERDPVLYLPPGWWKAYGKGAAVYNVAMAVWATPDTNVDDLRTTIDQRFSDRLHFLDRPIADPGPLTRVIDLQSLAAWVIALTTLVAGAAFVGQAIARQLRRELADRETLRALGFDRTHATFAAVSRMLPVAAGCALLAAVTAVLASPIGPIGLARQAEVDPGIHWDVPVIVIGSIAAGLAVLSVSAAVAWRSATAHASSSAVHGLAPRRWTLPVTARTGALLARTSGTRAAVISACVAIVAAVGAGGLLRSITTLENSPQRFGATWDLDVGAYTSYESLHKAQQIAEGHPFVTATGSMRTTTTEVKGHRLLIVAFDPQTDSAISPVVTDGRLPKADDEIALGTEAMSVLGVGIGDSFEPPPGPGTGKGSSTDPIGPLRVVGRVVVNDNGTDQRSGGAGGVITNGLFNRIDPTTVPQDVLLQLAPGTDLAAAVAELRPEFGGIIGLARPQADVRNLERVKPQLRVVAPVVILFAIAALTHALITTVRVRRRDLATMRALGFTGGQVAASIGWHAAFVQAVALVVGIPIGAIAAQWGWRSVETRLGVIPDSSVPWPTIVLAIAGALMVCALAALMGRLVGTPDTANALRSE